MRRPALLVLDRLIPIFPTLTGLARHLREALVYVTEHDKDEGMKTSAKAALARLDIEMESNKPGRWLELDAYNISHPKDSGPEGSQPATQPLPSELEDVVKSQMAAKQEPLPTEELHEQTTTRTSPQEQPRDVEMHEETEEGLIPVSSQKEEGELDKGQPRRGDRRARKPPEGTGHRASPRKRPSSKTTDAPALSTATPNDPPTRRSITREEVKKKRETAPRSSEVEKEMRRPKRGTREETRRKP